MKTEVKLCKDCKHIVLNEEWESQGFKEKYSLCGLTSVVNGQDGKRCVDARAGGWFSFCGRSGKKWEPK